MKKLYLFAIIILAFGCSGGDDDGSENGVFIDTRKFLEKYDGQGFGDAEGYYFFNYGVKEFLGEIQVQGTEVGNICWLYEGGGNYFGSHSEGNYEVIWIETKSHTDEALVITMDSTDNDRDAEIKFSVNAAGDILTVIFDEGTEDEYVARLNKTSETFSSLCDEILLSR